MRKKKTVEEPLCKEPIITDAKSSGAKGQTVCDERTINRTKTLEGDERDGEETLNKSVSDLAVRQSDNVVVFPLFFFKSHKNRCVLAAG